jgi:hypothetical protein
MNFNLDYATIGTEKNHGQKLKLFSLQLAKRILMDEVPNIEIKNSSICCLIRVTAQLRGL